MKFWLVVLLGILTIKGFSQEKSIAGIVFDKQSQDRIAKINVVNLNSGLSVYNNLNGVFTIDAQVGDVLVFKRLEYVDDTVKVENFIPIAVYMARTSIQLKEVTIRDTALTPEKKLAATKREYSKAYGSLAKWRSRAKY
jgi:co-chaperonin GroES (HSP10)